MTVILAVILLSAILALILQGTTYSIAHRHGLTLAHHQLQAEFLLRGGLARGMTQLRINPEYRGETWEIPATGLDGHAGSVQIEIRNVPNKPRQISVVAIFPLDVEHPVRRSETFDLLK
jgi:hypothetical protein